MSTYARLPISFARGEGAQLWDLDGNAYLDALGGIAVCGLGHAHPAVTAAICEQASSLVHTSNLYGIGRQQELADTLCRLASMDKVFFANSGAEANEDSPDCMDISVTFRVRLLLLCRVVSTAARWLP